MLYLRRISAFDIRVPGEGHAIGSSDVGPDDGRSLKRDLGERVRGLEQASLLDQRYVHLWADRIQVNVPRAKDTRCLLVLMGVTEIGTKEFVAVLDGVRESEQSWKEGSYSI